MKTKGKKLKRWPKHGSSVSNPEASRFREAAKTRFFKPTTGPSALTVQALQKHDGNDGMDVDPDSFDAQTFNTWATNFTDCTNVTFNRVHKLWNSNNALHKEILALLATLTEVIKEKGGTGTETEYFAALMIYMDTVESEESASAAALLLGMAVRKVPASSLQKRFSDISRRLLEAIIKYAQTEATSLLKSLLLALAYVLRVQEAASWTVSSTNNAYKIILDFSLHKKPRVKKAAQQAIRLILKGSPFLSQPQAPPYHPAAIPTADFCASNLQQKGGKVGVAEADVLHVLNLLQDVIVTFPRGHMQKSCELILKLMFINKPVVKANGMAALYGLFKQRPSAAALPAEVNAQIINALHDHQPAENDSGTMPGWLAVMEQAHLNLARLNTTLCMDHLPRLLSVAMKCLLSHQKDIRTAAAKLINLLLVECIGSQEELLAEKMKGVKANSAETSLHKVVRAMEVGLSYQYNANWDLVFHLLGMLLEVLGKICPDLLKKCLSSMADLRDSVSFSYKTEVDVAMGKAVRTMGPRLVLETVPLKITGHEENPDLVRSWVLPVIRDNVSHTELAFFTSFFLPLAARFRQKGKELGALGHEAVSRTYESLELQVWTMLKGFCTCPTDLAQSFKGLAKKLGDALTERPDLQLEVLSAVRSLVNFSKNSEADRAAMAQYAKNFLPLLFNAFTSDPQQSRDSRRLAVLETIKVYLSVTDPKLLSSFLDMTLSKMAEKDITAFRKIALVDLAIVMVSYADLGHLRKICSLAEENIKASDKTLQKKAYRILEEVCTCKSDTCQQYLSSNLTHLQQMLLSSQSAAPNTKNPRLRCLTRILHELDEPNSSFIQAVVAEAILCTRSVGERARAAAYQLIVEIAKTMVRWNPTASEQDVLSEYVNVLLAGLSGSPEMISGTLLALTRVMYHYKEKLSGNTLSSMIEIVCLLMKSERREIVKTALDFIKMLTGAFKQEILCAHLSEMVGGIASMKPKARQSFHMKIKLVFRKLVKKFKYEAVVKVAPATLHRVLHKVHQELKQEQKKKDKKDKDRADDSDEEPESSAKQKPETVEEMLQFSYVEEEEEEEGKPVIKDKGQRKVFIEEEGDEIVDILDKSVAKKVLASKPKGKTEDIKRRREEADFKIAPDGRLIITDPDEDKGNKGGSEDEDDLDDLLTTIEGGSEKKRRKRLRDASRDADEDEPQMKYKPGGGGIHRPLQAGQEFRAKKAGGDIKKGKLDPYAYIPLNFNNLNKRKQAKLKGQFSGLVKGARKGVLKARKGKGKK